MLPVDQKKRQLSPLIDKVNFIVISLLVDNQADPILPEQEKIQSKVNHIVLLTTVEADYLNRRERWSELLKQFSVKACPNGWY